MGRVAIFIDGGYLEHVQHGLGDPKIGFDKMASLLAQPDELLRTYYYHCLPYKSPSPTAEEAERFARKQRFFHALHRLDRFEVREGQLAFRGWDRGTGKPIFEQKRVDIKLAVDLVLLATKRQITRAVIVTGDSDFLPAIQAAKNEGVLVHLYHGLGERRPHRDLWDAVDTRTPRSLPLRNEGRVIRGSACRVSSSPAAPGRRRVPLRSCYEISDYVRCRRFGRMV